ncbi:hypothetical protein niasHS_003335 [Heterodera schachtii]|uniref:Uncharacterized protein n=1 Tax=Heterodera schachtii TaxID=97005 RepID=A0ABD2KG89_HETSC
MNSNFDDDGQKKEENQMGKMANERPKENGGKDGEKKKEEAEKADEKQKGGENGKKQLKESGEEFPLLVDEEEKEEEEGKCVHNKSGRCPWCDKTKEEDTFDD